jgi:hypothetical protein
MADNIMYAIRKIHHKSNFTLQFLNLPYRTILRS